MAKSQDCPVYGKHTFIEDNCFEICPICNWLHDRGIQMVDCFSHTRRLNQKINFRIEDGKNCLPATEA